ncbi:hypothetical protein DFJ77DRAFT_419734, partial [Powellomyces hirtus]
PNSLTLYPEFLTPEAQAQLATAADRKLRRICGRKYWDGHFDGVIRNYRECSVSAWAGPSAGDEADAVPREVVRKIKATVESEVGETVKWIDPHILDLGLGGEIRAHVDNIKASGSIITGLCLLAPAVIIFRHVKDPSISFSALMNPGTLYVQRDALRFDYTHEIPDDSALRSFKATAVPRGRRISVMMRNAK